MGFIKHRVWRKQNSYHDIADPGGAVGLHLVTCTDQPLCLFLAYFGGEGRRSGSARQAHTWSDRTDETLWGPVQTAVKRPQ